MANQFTEKLFQSIDTIISSRIQNLEYDQTIICEVMNSPDKEQGIYQVQAQSATMTAYSKEDYSVGDYVHVLVPLGDYTQKKIILGKVIKTEEPTYDTRPFEKYAPVTDNLNLNYGKDLDEYTFIVNRDIQKTIFNRTFNNPKEYMGYNQLGIKLSIYANMKSLTQSVVSGKYRLKITLRGIDLKKTTDLDFQKTGSIVEQYIDMEDMVFINPYFTSGYCNQEKVFDIENFALQSITIEIKQTEPFLDADGIEVASDNFYIKFKNIYCSLGYACAPNDINSEKLYAFPVDGLRYDFKTTITKQLDARLIKFLRDTRQMPYGSIIDVSSYNGWGLYSPSSSYIDEKFNIPGYDMIPGSSLKQNGVFNLQLNNNKGLLENKLILSMRRGDKYILSNEIIFYNNDYVKNADLLDNISGLTGMFSDNRESFNIYGLDNKLLNDYDENEIYYLILSYNSVNGRTILPGDTVYWTFPSNNTMLIPHDTSSIVQDTNNPNKFSVIIDELNPLYRDKNFWIPFRIKNVYNQNYINNTINCGFSFTDETGYNQKLSLSKSIAFGFSGSEGSEYIYNLELYKTVSGTKTKVQSIPATETNYSQYSVELKIYDYNMRPINNIETEYKWISESDTNFRKTIYLTDLEKMESNMDKILVARHKIIYAGSIQDESIVTYLPIGTFTGEEYLLEGCKTIAYDQFGTKPYYYKGEYKIYNKNGVEISNKDISFKLNFNLNTPETIRPQLITEIEQVNENTSNIKIKIKPYGVYFDQLNHFSIQVYSNTLKDNNGNPQMLLEFPIIIIQGQFSAMTEYKTNSIQIFNSEDKFEKILLGYLSENDKVGAHGLVLGIMDQPEQENTIGLYSYIEGDQFFTLDEKNGLIVQGDEAHTLINLYNGNLTNFNFINCNGTGTIENSKKLVDNNNTGLSVGSTNTPVYFSSGIPVVCSQMATSAELTTQINEMKNLINGLQNQINSLQNQINTLSK